MKKIFITISLISVIFSVYGNVFAMEFNDIPHGFWAYKQIDKLTDEGIISGYPDGNFLPSKLVTRAEYAAMVIKTIGQSDRPVDVMYSFEDIDVNHWAWPYVVRALNLDILKPVSEARRRSRLLRRARAAAW